MKNNLWFKHDRSARNDPKIQRAVRVKGAIVKAVYWDLIEMLYEEGGHLPFESIDDVAFYNHIDDVSIVKYLVFDSGLFEHNDTCFWSPRQVRDMDEQQKISEQKSVAGKASGASRSGNKLTDVEQMLNRCSTGVEPNKHTNIDNSNISRDIFSSETSVSEPKNQLQGELSKKQCQQVVDFWNKTVNETHTTLKRISMLTEAREKKIRIRWGEFKKIGDPVEVTRRIFNNACISKFLQGDNARAWSATFDWLFDNGKNWIKVYEGNYADKEVGGSSDLQVNKQWEGE